MAEAVAVGDGFDGLADGGAPAALGVAEGGEGGGVPAFGEIKQGVHAGIVAAIERGEGATDAEGTGGEHQVLHGGID